MVEEQWRKYATFIDKTKLSCFWKGNTQTLHSSGLNPLIVYVHPRITCKKCQDTPSSNQINSKTWKMATPLREFLRKQRKLCVSWSESCNFLLDYDDCITKLTITLKVFFSIWLVVNGEVGLCAQSWSFKSPIKWQEPENKFAQFGFSWANFCSLLDSIKRQIYISENLWKSLGNKHDFLYL